MPVNESDTNDEFVDDDAEMSPYPDGSDVIDSEYVDIDETSEGENIFEAESTTPDEPTNEIADELRTHVPDGQSTSPSGSKRESLIFGILATAFILVLVLGCGGYLYFYDLPRNSEADERTKKEATRRQNAVDSYKQLILKDFPNWQLIGDDFDESDLGSEERILITAHIQKENDSRSVSVVLHKLKANGSSDDEPQEYWFAYRPSLNQLKDIEIDKAKREALPEQ